MSETIRERLGAARRVVVKIGSRSLLATESGRFEQLAAQVQLDVGQLATDLPRDPGEDVVRRSADEAHADPTRSPGRDQGHVVAGPLDVGEDGAGVVGEPGACLGDLDPAGGPRQEGDTELALELLDLLGQRGLREVEPRGGAAEVPLLGEHDERPQMAQFHALNLSIVTDSVLEMMAGRGLGSRA